MGDTFPGWRSGPLQQLDKCPPPTPLLPLPQAAVLCRPAPTAKPPRNLISFTGAFLVLSACTPCTCVSVGFSVCFCVYLCVSVCICVFCVYLCVLCVYLCISPSVCFCVFPPCVSIFVCICAFLHLCVSVSVFPPCVCAFLCVLVCFSACVSVCVLVYNSAFLCFFSSFPLDPVSSFKRA